MTSQYSVQHVVSSQNEAMCKLQQPHTRDALRIRMIMICIKDSLLIVFICIEKGSCKDILP